MEHITHQVHTRFKAFLSPSFKDAAEAVRSFTASGSIAAKSIGVEFIDSSESLLISLGYAEGQPGYAVELKERAAGSVSAPEHLESALEAAADEVGDVICHELFVDSAGGVHLVLMVKL